MAVVAAKVVKHAQNVYNTIKCKDFGDYHWLYLKTDELVLADIFEILRIFIINHTNFGHD